MKKKNLAAVKLGSIKSAKKAAAARENGRKGGRSESQALRDCRAETSALSVIYEIRKAAGDPEGKLMLPDFICHIEDMRAALVNIAQLADMAGKTVCAPIEDTYRTMAANLGECGRIANSALRKP